MSTTRTLGIIAHIDAGKTTLTERMLFYTRTIHRLGEVHDGTATMDYLPEEQERGITITAACASCTWNETTINLVDTPGHVDFTIEVERSLRVLDGVVGVFCAVGGVEPQSETVWRQAEQFGIARLAFINKMDRLGANAEAVLEALSTRLQANPVPINMPLGAEEDFTGVVDLVTEELVSFDPNDQGRTVTRTPLSSACESVQDKAKLWRERLLEAVADHDDMFMEHYLISTESENGTIEPNALVAALRRLTLARSITPVLCGSALRNSGVQLLLDAVCAYLPSPNEVLPTKAIIDDTEQSLPKACDPTAPLAALVFKVLLEDNRKVAFLRLYAGCLSESDQCLNVNQDKTERVSRIYRIHADSREQLEQAVAGDIVAVIGLRSACTGDTITDPKTPLLLENIMAYTPVIRLALEPRNADEGKILDDALARFTAEDPTLKVEADEGSGHRIVSGMGELHLDVTLERMAREYKISPRTGNPQVIRRETVTATVEAEEVFERELGKQWHQGHVQLSIAPAPRGQGNSIVFADSVQNVPNATQALEAVRESIDNALQSGPLTGYPVQDVTVTVLAMTRDAKSTVTGYHMAAAQALRSGLGKARVVALEPLMLVEISSPEAQLGASISLFTSRGGKVENLEERLGMKIIQGLAPLSQLFGFSTALRSATQGRAGFSASFARFDAV